MKLSMLPCSLFNEIISDRIPLEQWISGAKEYGLDGVDVSMMFFHMHTQTYLDSVKRIIEKYQTPIVMATTYPDFTHPDKAQRDRELYYTAYDISICAQMGIPYLRILAGQEHEGTDRQTGINWAVAGIRRAADIADRFGVQLLYENHSKPGTWDNYDFSFPLDIFGEIMDKISDTSVRLNYDLGNTDAAGGDPVEVLKQYINKIETIHVTDMKEKGKVSQTLIGTGITPVGECFKVLKEYGWNNWLCIEEASNTGWDGIRQAAINTRKLWKEA